MCDDFYYEIRYESGTKCAEMVEAFIDSVEHSVVDGTNGIFYLQFGLNDYGYIPDPSNCAVDLNA